MTCDGIEIILIRSQQIGATFHCLMMRFRSNDGNGRETCSAGKKIVDLKASNFSSVLYAPSQAKEKANFMLFEQLLNQEYVWS